MTTGNDPQSVLLAAERNFFEVRQQTQRAGERERLARNRYLNAKTRRENPERVRHAHEEWMEENKSLVEIHKKFETAFAAYKAAYKAANRAAQ